MRAPCRLTTIRLHCSRAFRIRSASSRRASGLVVCHPSVCARGPCDLVVNIRVLERGGMTGAAGLPLSFTDGNADWVRRPARCGSGEMVPLTYTMNRQPREGALGPAPPRVGLSVSRFVLNLLNGLIRPIRSGEARPLDLDAWNKQRPEQVLAARPKNRWTIASSSCFWGGRDATYSTSSSGRW